MTTKDIKSKKEANASLKNLYMQRSALVKTYS
jgi:hypothetical protein